MTTKELQLEVDETGSILDGSMARAHQDASGGKGGSNEMLWAVLEEVFLALTQVACAWLWLAEN